MNMFLRGPHLFEVASDRQRLVAEPEVASDRDAFLPDHGDDGATVEFHDGLRREGEGTVSIGTKEPRGRVEQVGGSLSGFGRARRGSMSFHDFLRPPCYSASLRDSPCWAEVLGCSPRGSQTSRKRVIGRRARRTAGRGALLSPGGRRSATKRPVRGPAQSPRSLRASWRAAGRAEGSSDLGGRDAQAERNLIDQNPL